MVRIKSNKNLKSISNETQKEFFKQILFPLLIAGFGMAYAGIMFDYMKAFNFLSEMYFYYNY